MFSAGLEYFSGGTLAVLGNDILPFYQEEDIFKIYRFRLNQENFLKRTEEFTFCVHSLLKSSEDWKLVHFRDIWGGLAAIQITGVEFKTIFEVNSLPSIELKFRYPELSRDTLQKIEDRENILLEFTNKVVTPSHVTREYLINNRGIHPEKVVHLPNGSEVIQTYERPRDIKDDYLIYFGAIQDWQGIDILLKAFSLLRDMENLRLLLCISGAESSAKYLIKYANKLDLGNRIIWKFGLGKEELYPYIQHAILSVVPLKEDERNLIQGASPIKIFESMAAGVPLLVSDLPIVREILTDRKHAKLIRPDRPMELAVQIRFLLESPQLRKALAGEAKKLFLEKYTWEHIKINLQSIYDDILNNRNRK